jgi:hypothetical protein
MGGWPSIAGQLKLGLELLCAICPKFCSSIVDKPFCTSLSSCVVEEEGSSFSSADLTYDSNLCWLDTCAGGALSHIKALDLESWKIWSSMTLVMEILIFIC